MRWLSSESLVAPVVVEFVEDELVEGEVVVVEGEVVVVEGEVVVVEGDVVVVCEPEPDPPPEPPPVPAAKARAAVPSRKVPASVIVRRCLIVIYKNLLWCMAPQGRAFRPVGHGSIGGLASLTRWLSNWF